MIISALVSLIALVIKGIIALIPDLSAITLPDGFTQWFVDLINVSSYFLPIADFVAMLGIWLLVTNFKIIWKIVQRIWDSLPFV